jgi:CubicO group peptidase (beta-lactamase class C family)
VIQTNQLDQVLQDIISRWGIPGLGIGIVEGEEITYARWFGVQSLDTRVPVTQKSIFGVASVSKCFVATAVMQLSEHGKIGLDIPIIHYLPYFRLDDNRYTQITTRLILSHTSGIPDMDEAEYDELVYHPETDEGASERYVRGLRNRKMIGAPGERFAYSNIAYNVLGVLIAKVSGQNFEDYMKEHILHPAGMPDSTFFFPEISREQLAVPHLRTPEMTINPVYPYHRADAPASFLHSTVLDMCHWSITSLNGGVYKGNRILSADKYPLMWTPIAPRNYPPFYEHTGLGWTLGHYEGWKTVSHGGGGFGWTDFLILLPEKNCGAVILCNEESSAHENIILAVVDAMLGREPQAGLVSWMIPISRALKAGGIREAYDCYAEVKESIGNGYLFDAHELIPLVYQIASVGKLDLAIEVLMLNLTAFPDHEYSHELLSRFLQRESRTRNP